MYREYFTLYIQSYNILISVTSYCLTCQSKSEGDWGFFFHRCCLYPSQTFLQPRLSCIYKTVLILYLQLFNLFFILTPETFNSISNLCVKLFDLKWPPHEIVSMFTANWSLTLDQYSNRAGLSANLVCCVFECVYGESQWLIRKKYEVRSL